MKTIAALLLSIFSLHSSTALAWGEEGHAIVAIVAQKSLSETANHNIKHLLLIEDTEQLSDIASWADSIRGTEPGLVSHAVRIPFSAEKYDTTRDCSGRGKCVIFGIEEAERTLKNASSTDLERLRALKFLVHFVGDVHQPLHAIQETGQMETLIGDHHWTLHKVWDSMIIRSFNKPAQEVADELLSNGHPVAQLTPADWAIESHDIARNVIYGNNEELAKSTTPLSLSKNYFQVCTPIIKERLYTAGIRLGYLLNQLFGQPNS